jgi:hypothetical protein
LKARLYLISAAILVLGLAGALLIYFTAADPEETGQVFYDSPQLSKKYIRELERFGGKQAVIFDEIIRWLDGRFSGKALGVTLGWISVVVALALFLFARWLPPDKPR